MEAKRNLVCYLDSFAWLPFLSGVVKVLEVLQFDCENLGSFQVGRLCRKGGGQIANYRVGFLCVQTVS